VVGVSLALGARLLRRSGCKKGNQPTVSTPGSSDDSGITPALPEVPVLLTTSQSANEVPPRVEVVPPPPVIEVPTVLEEVFPPPTPVLPPLPEAVPLPPGTVPRPRIMLMAGGDNSRGSIKRITATHSFELHDQLIEWRALAFQRITDRSDRIHESSLIHLLKQDLGADSALRAFAEAPSGTAQFPDMPAEEIAIQISVMDNNAKRAQARSSGGSRETQEDKRNKAFETAVTAAYQTFVPCPIDPDMAQFKRQADVALAANTGTLAYFEQAKNDSRLAESMIAEAKAAHDNKSIDEKWAELNKSQAATTQVEFAMKAFEMRHGRSAPHDRSDSSAANLPDHEMLPYRSPEDLRGVTWLIQFCIFRTGGFTQEDVTRLMNMHMKPGEAPLQAATRVMRWGQILQDAGIPGFDKDYRLWDLLTNQSRPGGPFFTRALYDKIELVVSAELKRLNLHRVHTEAALRIWIQVADETFTAARGHNLELDRKIQDECVKRQNSGGKQNKDAKGTPAAPAAGKGDTPKGPNMDKGAGSKWCNMHGYNQTHTTDDCRTLERQLKAAGKKQDELVRMATTIPQPGANPADKGLRPGAAYNNNRTPTAEGHPAARGGGEKHTCRVCSELAGHPVEHRPDSCFMQQGVRVPEWFQPLDARRRQIVNDKRVAQGMTRLPDAPPKPAGRAYTATPLDCPAGVPASEYRVVAMIGRTSLQVPGLFDHVSNPVHRAPAPEIPPGTPAKLPSESELEFVPSTRRFICKLHRTLCENVRNPHNGELLTVTCDGGRCRTWAASELPYDWASKNRWTTDPSAMPELFQTPSRAPQNVGRPETIAANLDASLPMALGRSVASSSASNTTLASLTGGPNILQPSWVMTAPPLPFPMRRAGGLLAPQEPAEASHELGHDNHPFASPIDQMLFGCILDDYRLKGGSSRFSEVSRILAGTTPEARQFHLGRMEAARQAWASTQLDTAPRRVKPLAPVNLLPNSGVDTAPAAGRLGPLPLSALSPSTVPAQAAPGAAHASVEPSVIPDPCAGLEPVQEIEILEESVSFGVGLDAATGSEGLFMHSSFPYHTPGGDESGFEAARTPEPLRTSSRPGYDSAAAGTESQAAWHNAMALDFVPRNEFEREQAEADLVANRVHTLEDQLKTVRLTADTAALRSSSVDGEVRWLDLDSRMARVTTLAHRAIAELQLSNDPKVDASRGTIPELMGRMRALELKDTPDSYAKAVDRSGGTSQVDVRALLSETETRLRGAIDLRATSQAVDILAQSVETAKNSLSGHIKGNNAAHHEHSLAILKHNEALLKQGGLLRSLRSDLDTVQTKVTRVSSRVAVGSGPNPLPGPEVAQGEVDELAQKVSAAANQILSLEESRDKLRQDLDAHVTAVSAVHVQPAEVPTPVQDSLDDLTAKFNDMAIKVTNLGGNAQVSAAAPVAVAPSSPFPAEAQAVIDDLTSKVKALELQAEGFKAFQDRKGLNVLDRIQLDLATTTNGTHDVLITAQRLKLDDVKSVSDKAASDVRIETVTRRAEIRAQTATASALTSQIVGLQAEIDALKSAQTASEDAHRPLKEWADTFKLFFRGWESNQVHDGNFLWEQIRLLKDDVHQGWRQQTNYHEPLATDAQLVLNKRPFLEQPVQHAANSVRNYGSTSEPAVAYNDTTGPSPQRSTTRVDPALTVAALSPKGGAGPSRTPPSSPRATGSAPSSPLRLITSSKRPMPLTHEEQLALRTPINSEGSESSEGTRLQESSTATSQDALASPCLGMPPSTVNSPRGAKSPKVEGRNCLTAHKRYVLVAEPNVLLRTLADSVPSSSAPAWGPPDFDTMTDPGVGGDETYILDDYFRMTPEEYAAHYVASIAQQAPGMMLDSVSVESGDSVPEDRLWSVDQRAALAAALAATEDETPERMESVSRAMWPVAIPGAVVYESADSEALSAVPEEKLVPTVEAGPATPRVGAVSGPAIALPIPAAPSSDSGPSVQSSDEAGRGKTSRNRRSRQRRRQRSKTFGKIPANLQPRSPEDLRPRVKDGKIELTPRESESHAKFFDRMSTMITLKQRDPLASLFLLNTEQTRSVKPGAVMCDTGADLSIMIAPKIATYLGITWTPGSAQLFGIGGVASGHSYADEGQRIVLRLGGFDLDKSVGPWEGCHVISYRPIIMEASVVEDLGAEVILGQRALRSCLAQFDPITETLDYSPAWFEHGCSSLRCSIPCHMSRPKEQISPAAAVARRSLNIIDTEENESMADQRVAPVAGPPRPARKPETQASGGSIAATDGSRHEPTTARAEHLAQPKVVTFEKHPKALGPDTLTRAATPWPRAEPGACTGVCTADPAEAPDTAIVTPVALHPGFPQTPAIPSRGEAAELRLTRKERRRRNRQEAECRAAEARTKHADKLSSVVSPLAISYSVRDLQASGRLLDGFKLDLSSGGPVTNEQLDSLVERLLPQLTQQLAKGASPAPNAGRKHGNQSRTKGSSSSDATSDKDSSSDSSVAGTAPSPAAAPVPVPAGATPAAPAAGPSYASVVAADPPAIATEAAAGVPASKPTPVVNKPEPRRNPPRGGRPNPEGGGGARGTCGGACAISHPPCKGAL
jgi:hypothetical protein